MENNQARPLKRSSEYLLVSQKGQKIRLSRWLLLILLPSNDENSYYGITVSKKVGNAVLRNKLKRWVRNCVKSEVWPRKLSGKKAVFVFRPQDKDEYKKIEYKDFKECFLSI